MLLGTREAQEPQHPDGSPRGPAVTLLAPRPLGRPPGSGGLVFVEHERHTALGACVFLLRFIVTSSFVCVVCLRLGGFSQLSPDQRPEMHVT